MGCVAVELVIGLPDQFEGPWRLEVFGRERGLWWQEGPANQEDTSRAFQFMRYRTQGMRRWQKLRPPVSSGAFLRRVSLEPAFRGNRLSGVPGGQSSRRGSCTGHNPFQLAGIVRVHDKTCALHVRTTHHHNHQPRPRTTDHHNHSPQPPPQPHTTTHPPQPRQPQQPRLDEFLCEALAAAHRRTRGVSRNTPEVQVARGPGGVIDHSSATRY